MIQEGMLKAGYTFIREDGRSYVVGGYIEPTINILITENFTIEKKKEYMTFDEAKKKGIPKHKDFTSNKGTMTIETFIKEVDEKVWEVQD